MSLANLKKGCFNFLSDLTECSPCHNYLVNAVQVNLYYFMVRINAFLTDSVEEKIFKYPHKLFSLQEGKLLIPVSWPKSALNIDYNWFRMLFRGKRVQKSHKYVLNAKCFQHWPYSKGNKVPKGIIRWAFLEHDDLSIHVRRNLISFDLSPKHLSGNAISQN